MPGPFQNPHNPPAVVQPAETSLARDHSVQVNPDTNLTLHNLRVNEATGEASLSGFSAQAFGRSLLQASAVPLVDPSTNRRAEPADLYRQSFHQTFSTQSELQRHMEMLGIDRAEAFIALKPGQEYAALTTYGEFFNQNFEANRAGFSYAVSGAPIGDATEWLTNGRGQFSSIRMWSDGQQFLFAPAYTLPSVVPGFSTTLSGNVSTIMNSTRGLTPQYQHLLSGDPNDPYAGVPVASGRFTYNSFGMADSVVSTFDFRGERIDSSLYVGTGFNGYNFVAFRGMGDLMGGVAQADALFAQSVAGGSGLGAALRFATDIKPATLQFSLEGYKQFQGASGEFSPGVGHVLGLEPNSGEHGVRFGLEILRR